MENIKYKILLIEDDKIDQMAFMKMVRKEKLPYDFIFADSIAQARQFLSQQHVDIIIADYMLGDGTAFDILNSVKNIPVILVTGAGDEEIAINAWKNGASDYLIKDSEKNYLRMIPITLESVIRHNQTEKMLQLLSGAVMNTGDSVYITDMEDRIVFVNKAFCKTYGYSEQEVMGQNCSVFCSESPLSKDARNIFRNVDCREMGFYHKRKDGTKFLVSLSRSAIKDESGNAIALVGIARDISENILTEDKVRALNRKFPKIRQPMN